MSATRFTVPASHPSLPGHFPGRPLVPGVVLLAHVQAAIEAAHGPLAALRLPQVKFMRPLSPGEPAAIELERMDAPLATRDPGAGVAGARRWRFRVLREADGAVLASGEFADA